MQAAHILLSGLELLEKHLAQILELGAQRSVAIVHEVLIPVVLDLDALHLRIHIVSNLVERIV